MSYPTAIAAAAAALAAAAISLAGTAGAAPAPATAGNPATDATARANAAVLQQLPFQDRRDFEAARRGFIGTLDNTEIRDAKGNVVWALIPTASSIKTGRRPP